MRRFVTLICLIATTSWAADRDLSLRDGEKRSFKLPGVTQVAIDDAAVVEATGKNDQLTVVGRRAGSARILVLLKNDQWVTFKVKVLPSNELGEGPVPEALPADGEPVRLRVGEGRMFETAGIQKMPATGSQNFEAKVNGKLLELRGVAPGRAVLDVTFNGGKRTQLPILVEGEKVMAPPKRVDSVPGERIELPVSGEVLVKAPDVEAVQVADDDVAEVRIVGDGRVVVRGLQEGETIVNVRRAGKLYSHAVNVFSDSPYRAWP